LAFLAQEEGRLPGTVIGRTRRRALLAPAEVIALAGCTPAPSQTIFGAYFPSWMLCALVGLGATVVVRQLLVAVGMDKFLPVPLVVYLTLATAFAFAMWLAWLD
jgi:YtcA family